MKLYDDAKAVGLKIDPEVVESKLRPLAHYFHRPGKGEWSYPARYPVTSLSAWVEPNKNDLRTMVESIVGQAKKQLG